MLRWNSFHHLFITSNSSWIMATYCHAITNKLFGFWNLYWFSAISWWFYHIFCSQISRCFAKIGSVLVWESHRKGDARSFSDLPNVCCKTAVKRNLGIFLPGLWSSKALEQALNFEQVWMETDLGISLNILLDWDFSFQRLIIGSSYFSSFHIAQHIFRWWKDF